MNQIEVCRGGECRRYADEWICGKKEESGFLTGAGILELVVRAQGGFYARLCERVSGEKIMETRRGWGVLANGFEEVGFMYDGNETSVKVVKPNNNLRSKIMNFLIR